MLELADPPGRIWNELIEQGACDECWIPYAQFEGSELEASDDILAQRGRTDEAGHVRMAAGHPRDRYPEAYAGCDAIRSLRAKPAARAALQDQHRLLRRRRAAPIPGRTITQKTRRPLGEDPARKSKGLDFQPDITRYSYLQAFSSGDLGASLRDPSAEDTG
ncbi:MAG: hypothetical protein R3E96_17245 [Planctomycetota bacterium]